MSTPRTQTHRVIAEILGVEILTGPQIASRGNLEWMGVESALKSMAQRGEVVRLKQLAPGQPFRYRLREAV